MHPGAPAATRAFRWFGVLVAAGLVAGLALDLIVPNVSRWFSDHQFVTSFAVDAGLLVVASVLIERTLRARRERRLAELWRQGAKPALTQLLEHAQQLDLPAWSVGHGPDDPRELSAADFQKSQADLLRLAQSYFELLDRLTPVFMAAPELVRYLPVARAYGEAAWPLAVTPRSSIRPGLRQRYYAARGALADAVGEDMHPEPRMPLGMLMEIWKADERRARSVRGWRGR